MLIVVIYIIPEGQPAGSFRFLNLHHYMGITLHFYLDELGMQFWSARLFKKVGEKAKVIFSRL